jgi:hypothetical protein
VQRPEVPIAKVQYARRMAPRQLAANKLLTAAFSEGVEDLIIGKVAQARVAQGRQNAALKSNKRVFAEKP